MPAPPHASTTPDGGPRPRDAATDRARPRSARLGVMVLLLAFLLGVFAGRFQSIVAVLRPGPDWRAALDEVRQIIHAEAIEPVADELLWRGAIDGTVAALGDRYAQFMPPVEASAFERETTRRFSGIGATISPRDGLIAVVSPVPGSPALAAGLRPDDRIAAIDGRTTLGLTVDDARDRLLGEPGTLVVLTVLRGPEPGLHGPPVHLDVSIRRGPVAAPSLVGLRYVSAGVGQGWDHTLDAGLGAVYARLEQFTPAAEAELRAALTTNPPPRFVVLDLRGNGGGLLDQAAAVADLFMESGPIVTTRPRAGSATPARTFDATPGTVAPGARLVVLIDPYTASASEVVAGALQESAGALVIGTRSFGKGVVQHVLELRSIPGARLRLTEQRFYLPSGRLLDRSESSEAQGVWGVDPTAGFEMALTPEAASRVVAARRRLEAVRPNGDGAGIPGPLPGEPRVGLSVLRFDDPDWVERELGDTPLAAALRAIRAAAAGGPWPPPPPHSPAPVPPPPRPEGGA